MPKNNKKIGRPSENEKNPTSGMDDKYSVTTVKIVFNLKGKEIGGKTSASKKPVEGPKSTELGTSVVSIKAEYNNKEMYR